MAGSLEAVHTHTHTHTSNFIKEIKAKMPLLILEADYEK